MTQTPPLNLLLSNDDGIFALGIRTLANTLARAGHRVTVVCPDRERSATGHGLTIHQPIRAQEIDAIFDPEITAWSCSGTPSDCIKFGLNAVMETRPDFILAGINHGSNLGTDVLYSGTVSAAMEGAIEGIPSVAFSLAAYVCKDFQPAADFAQRLVTQFVTAPVPSDTLLNVNIPAVPTPEFAGVIITRQGLRRYIEAFEQRIDPRGKHYYWLAGEAIEDLEQPVHGDLPPHIAADVHAIRKNYITITPLQHDLTAVKLVRQFQHADWNHLVLPTSSKSREEEA